MNPATLYVTYTFVFMHVGQKTNLSVNPWARFVVETKSLTGLKLVGRVYQFNNN